MATQARAAARRSANEVVGLSFAVALPVLVLTGAAIWWLRSTDRAVGLTLVVVHAWAGLVSLPILAAKIAVGVRAWYRKSRRPARLPTRHHLLTFGLVVSVMVLYATGTAMYANTTPGGNAVYKQVHLGAAIVSVALIGWHLVLYLRRALQLVDTARTRADEVALATSRRRVLGWMVLGGLAWGGGRGALGLLTSSAQGDPNDFPVTIAAGGSDRPDPATWRLRVGGDVQRELEFDHEQLRSRPRSRFTYPLDCVIGWSVTREWGGVSLGTLLDEAEPSGEVLTVAVRSTTGYEVALPPGDAWRDETLVAWEVERVDLTPEHGFPGRLMVPDVIGEQCVKWIDEVRIVTARSARADA
jgi:DMSO/TMAO reductase YedYZ molybdopterin-dependent catalytic subunit